ncbi:MAG: class I SAM-dependent methyltransferase [Anaerolineaceae bacterium]|nr:class I SAM-dependent methyltransferase [Anaerolineaceae bacterium]
MSEIKQNKVHLDLLPLSEYAGVDEKDPIKFYNLPVIGRMYQRRIELCLAELKGGQSILEIGFGSGVSFLNLHKLYQEIFGLDLTADTQLIANFFKAKNIDTRLENGNILSMPYPISILEHLQPGDQSRAFQEIRRVLKPGGQVVYGVPVERPFMVFMFRLLGTDIRTHHFSTEKDVYQAASQFLAPQRIQKMSGPLGLFGQVYEVGHFTKN